jgi:hypothetical protein
VQGEEEEEREWRQRITTKTRMGKKEDNNGESEKGSSRYLASGIYQHLLSD